MSDSQRLSASAVFSARLTAVEDHLVSLQRGGARTGLTEPDSDGAERWSEAEVWAHLAEFPDYWVDQLILVISGQGAQAVPFGRTKADPKRKAAIGAARRDDLGEYLERLLSACERLTALLSSIDSADWDARGVHPSLGEMGVDEILEEFLIGHLEEHAAQLEALGE